MRSLPAPATSGANSTPGDERSGTSPSGRSSPARCRVPGRSCSGWSRRAICSTSTRSGRCGEPPATPSTTTISASGPAGTPPTRARRRPGARHPCVHPAHRVPFRLLVSDGWPRGAPRRLRAGGTRRRRRDQDLDRGGVDHLDTRPRHRRGARRCELPRCADRGGQRRRAPPLRRPAPRRPSSETGTQGAPFDQRVRPVHRRARHDRRHRPPQRLVLRRRVPGIPLDRRRPARRRPDDLRLRLVDDRSDPSPRGRRELVPARQHAAGRSTSTPSVTAISCSSASPPTASTCAVASDSVRT